MAIEAVIQGLGIVSFILIYASFKISDERLLEKIPMYFFGLMTAFLIPFALLVESNQVGSTIDFLNGFFNNYFVTAIGFVTAMVFLYALFIIIKKLNNLGGDKEEDGKK